MNRIATTLSIAAAFAAGCGVTHLLRPASPPTTSPRRSSIPANSKATRSAPANAGGMRNKTVRLGRRRDHLDPGRQPPKHLHPNANEMQYILEGTGTIWLGDKEVQVKPGDLVIIPKGTPHGGTKPDGRTIKAIAIKTPPQAPDDTKLLN